MLQPRHDATTTESSEEDSARTPSPILGPRRGADDSDKAQGHLTFPQVGLGLGQMEHEMQVLIGSDEDLEELDEKLGDPHDRADADVFAGITERLAQLGYAEDHTAAAAAGADAPREAQLAQLAWDLVHRVQTQKQSQERLKHLVQVTRRASLSMLSSLRISYAHMLHAERDIKDRLEVELYGSKSQSRMLSDMVSRASLNAQEDPRAAAQVSGSAPASSPAAVRNNAHLQEPIQLTDVSMGADDAEPEEEKRALPPGTSPLVAERNKLLADKRFLRQRVRDAEAQAHRLETELKALRPVLLRHASTELEQPGDAAGMLDAAATPTHPARSSARASRRRREATMGDAETEHLILAARMLRTLRHRARSLGLSPSSTARGASGGAPYTPTTETSPSKYKSELTPSTPRTQDQAYPPSTPTSAVARQRMQQDSGEQMLRPGALPRATESPTRAGSGHTDAWQPHQRNMSTASNNSYSNGIDELLHAAQSLTGSAPRVAPSPSKRQPHLRLPDGATGAAEPPVSSPLAEGAPAGGSVFGSPKRRRVSPSAMDVDSERLSVSPTRPGAVSALDVLADQAAASEQPRADAPSHRRVHSSSQAAGERPPWTPVAASKAQPPPATESKAGTSNQSPEKRLPYVRWSAEEDVKLRRAIKEHGQRWEYVARAVGTRSYHQCRQRYLLMRRKEAAANGLTSPSKPSVPRTPSRTPGRAGGSGSARRDAPGTPTSATHGAARPEQPNAEASSSEEEDEDEEARGSPHAPRFIPHKGYPPRLGAPGMPHTGMPPSPAAMGRYTHSPMYPHHAPPPGTYERGAPMPMGGSPHARSPVSPPGTAFPPRPGSAPRPFPRGRMSPALYS